DAHPAKVVAEARLHLRPRGGVERLTWPAQHLMDRWWREAQTSRAIRLALHGEPPGPAGGTLPVRPRRAAAGALALQQPARHGRPSGFSSRRTLYMLAHRRSSLLVMTLRSTGSRQLRLFLPLPQLCDFEAIHLCTRALFRIFGFLKAFGDLFVHLDRFG